jgi:cytoskeletal protein CcmA (bactofilin family)
LDSAPEVAVAAAAEPERAKSSMTLKEAPPMSRPPFAGMQPLAARSPTPVKREVERRTLVIGRGISLEGVVRDAERLVVEGVVEATLIHAAELVVAPGGVFKGTVEAEDADIAGTVDGTLVARGSLTLRATGKLLGTARCRRLQVEDGGRITGQLEMLTEPSDAPKSDDDPAF